MRTVVLGRLSPLMIGLPLLAAVLAAVPEAHAAGPGMADSMADMLPARLGLDQLSSTLNGVLSWQSLLGFLVGLAAGEGWRIASKAGTSAWKATIKFGAFAGQYGALAVLLGAALYFI